MTAFVAATPVACARARAPAASGRRPARACAAGSGVSRRAVLRGLAAAAAAGVVLPGVAAESTTTETGLRVKVLEEGRGAKIVVGDLCALRFRGVYNGVAFDDLFATDQPYFYRAGSDLVLKGIAEAVMLMRVGDLYELEIPPELAFGKKGRRASAGKPSIPAGAYVTYTLFVESIPGKQSELIELEDVADDEVADADDVVGDVE